MSMKFQALSRIPRQGRGATQKGIRVKPLTTYLQQELLHKAIRLLLIHCLHMFTSGFIPTGVFRCSQLQISSISLPLLLCHLFVKEVLKLCQQSMELLRYITAVSSVFCQKSTLSLPVPPPPCQLTRSLSTEVTAATNANEPHPNPQLSVNRSGCFIFTSMSTLNQTNS